MQPRKLKPRIISVIYTKVALNREVFTRKNHCLYGICSLIGLVGDSAISMDLFTREAKEFIARK